jgi:hypothetical protein
MPQHVLDNSTRFTKKIRHAWATFSEFSLDVSQAYETNGTFTIKMDDPYLLQYYLDNTFMVINVPFDQQLVNEQWYDASTDASLAGKIYYKYDSRIEADTSTLIILKSEYDQTNYMIAQNNIWTVTNSETGDLVFRVHNESVPYIFDKIGTYNVQVETYDFYGNMATRMFEGLIKIK